VTRAVIVTGAAGGIGAALCDRMRKDGYIAIGIDRNVATAADTYLQVDLSDTEQLVQLGGELARDYELKAVVHNGAVQPIAAAGETPFDEWTNALRVNVLAVDALVSGTRESLAANDGSVVAISSVHGRATTGASRHMRRPRPRSRAGSALRPWISDPTSVSTPSARGRSTRRSCARGLRAGASRPRSARKYYASAPPFAGSGSRVTSLVRCRS
jgi:NAD(P)-dependent dehydrogenase (short-subunit alcohol dehydrogenase family)